MPYGAPGGGGGASIGGAVTGGTTGSVLFIGAASVLAQDNANFFWDDTNNRLGIGNAAPAQALDVTGNIGVSGSIELGAAADTTLSRSSAGVLAVEGVPVERFASGTRLIFQQTAAPTGWTKEAAAAFNDAALRFTTGAAGTGGADAFNTLFGTPRSTANYTLTVADTPAHAHPGSTTTGENVTAQSVAADDPGGSGSSVSIAAGTVTIASQGGGGAHAHTLSNFNIKFVDSIIAQKD